MKHVQRFFVAMGFTALLFGAVFAPVSTQSVQAITSQQAACEAINGKEGCTKSNADLTTIIKLIVEVLSVVIGVIAVIMIIMAGFKYITSGGDTSKVTAAKNALIYALIGLVIVALAQFLVRVVIRETDKATSLTPLSSLVA